jgi:hypothetical protein
LEKLRAHLDSLLNRLEDTRTFRSRLLDLQSVYPFSEYEYILSHLLAVDKLTLEEYEEIRSSYIDRNLYLYLFEISAPRGFGEVWAHGHLKSLIPNLQRPSKSLDATYAGEYDFFLPPGIKIEIKASRAVEFETDQPLYVKALASDSGKPFDMNFQQIKPACCHVFVWMAAWRDEIRYWVIPAHNVEHDPQYSPGQHRGNIGEGQLHLNRENIHRFDKYLVESNRLELSIRHAYDRELELRR